MTVASELLLPGVEPGDGAADATIRLGVTPDRLESPTAGGTSWQASAGQILVTVDRIARILILGGCEVVVTPADGVSAHDLAYAVLRAAISSLLHQREVLVLHASAALRPDDRAIAIAGPSTSGKSTVLLACLQRGWGMITDDIAALEVPLHGEAHIWSGHPVIGLWRDVLDRFSLDLRGLPAVRSRVEKFNWQAPVPHSPTAPLAAIVVLERGTTAGIRWERLEGRRAFAALRANVRGLSIAESQHRHGTFRRLAAVADRTPVFSICRPHADLDAAPAIVDLIEVIGEGSKCFSAT